MTNAKWFTDIELGAGSVSLRPMVASDAAALVDAAADGQLWELWYTQVPSADTVDH